jgi:sulfate adenylyltransferase
VNLNLDVSYEDWLEAENITNGTYYPLQGFLRRNDYHSVVDRCALVDGYPWTIPVTLDIPQDIAKKVAACRTLTLKYEGQAIALVTIQEVYEVDYPHDIPKLFGTSDPAHPGVKKESIRSPFRVGGVVTLLKKTPKEYPNYDLEPWEVKEKIADRGLKTVVGFQTRNPLHRAHEYLQRIGLEVCDGLFIQPLVGWKKVGDFTPDAIISAYQKMVETFYPSKRVILGTLRIPMRYAGPREAVLHALVRKNYGCTHFIVGRDHAGVGNFYGKYEAQDFACGFADLGITILPLCGPYYCTKCDSIVTEKTCSHTSPDTREVSGTLIRKMLSEGKCPPKEVMRPEIASILITRNAENTLFIQG